MLNMKRSAELSGNNFIDKKNFCLKFFSQSKEYAIISGGWNTNVSLYASILGVLQTELLPGMRKSAFLCIHY